MMAQANSYLPMLKITDPLKTTQRVHMALGARVKTLLLLIFIHTTMTASGQDGDILIGCGIMDMDMETFGVMDIIIFGPDHTLIIGECMIRLIPFLAIITHSMADMVIKDTLVCGGMDIIPGIITTLIQEIGILLYL